ncbi:phage baseplate assembly protein V [Palleronia caenipelagi]|uniref:Phage baseplate assembly protein V n=1 Tax=Palleronia caenipelagi TaxID=2489174 RepID=A0A547PS52_9RHOB|nr:phage baseplate assembly protein V [Palleronia caenipelagi]TRD16963.1 phage baseplate assembly protein V [Palleronia caenipelagi]
MAELAHIIDDLRRRISELERRIRSQSRTGVVTEVNAAEGLARVRLLDGEIPFVTGWIPWEEPAAGANRTHLPPSVGQQVRINSESGDLYDASIQASLNSDAIGRPSGAGDAYVLSSVGPCTITVSDGGGTCRITVGGSSITLTGSAITLASNGSTLVLDAGGIQEAGAKIEMN